LAFILDDKHYQMRLAHLCSTRNFPSPALTSARKELELDAFHERLTRRWPIYPGILDAVEKIGARFSHYVKAGDIPSQAHLSLSGTASFNTGRSRGGRAVDFLATFIDDYVKTPQAHTIQGLTWFGATYCLKEGYPAFMTMCRAFPLKVMRSGSVYSHGGVILNKATPFLESNFETPFRMPGEPLFTIEEPMFGLDCQTGYQLLQYAIEQGIKSEVLEGTPMRVAGSSLTVGAKRPKVRAELIGEPGNKVRVITVAESWETIFLQPLGHELAPILSSHPRLTSGFLRSYKGYDFLTNLSRVKEPIPEDHEFLFGDLEAASDNMTLEYTRALLHGILNGAGRQLPLLHVMVDLLTTSHAVYRLVDKVPVFWFNTTSGILMGHPGTKEAVSANWLLAHELAVCVYHAKQDLKSFLCSPRPKFLELGESAGDDFVEIGTPAYLNCVIECHRLLGHRINTKKVLITRRAAQYCEEPLLLTKQLTCFSEPLWKMEYNSHGHVDAIKIRLFSPYGKVEEGPGGRLNEPAIGKASALVRKLDWLPDDWKHHERLIINRWYFRMCRYTHRGQALSYTPSHFGGANMPYIPEVEHLIDELINDRYYALTCLRVLDGTADGFDRRILRALSQGGEIRGIEMDIREQAHEQYVMMAQIAGCFKTLDEIAVEAMIPATKFRSFARAKKRVIASTQGYIPEFDLNLLIEKSWVVKQSCQVAAGLRPLENPIRINYDAGLQSFQLALDALPSRKATMDVTRYSDTDRARLKEAIVKRTRPRTNEERYVKRDILSKSFSLLEVPLPSPSEEDRSFVRGSTRDVF
jgi:hypothetical protein